MSSKNKGKNNAYVRNLNENNNKNKNYSVNDVRSLPTSEYIQATVQKDVQEALLVLARRKPNNPIEFLGKYLLDKSKQ
jgi:hypothetical protein